MKKLLLLALLSPFAVPCKASSSSFPIAYKHAPQDKKAQWTQQFTTTVLLALKANPASFVSLINKLKTVQYLLEFDVDSIAVNNGSQQGTLGTVLDNAVAGQIAAPNGAQLSVIQAKIISALVYEKRSKKGHSKTPLALYRELIDAALKSNNGIEDLQRFHNAGLKGCTIHQPMGDDDDEPIYEFLQHKIQNNSADSLADSLQAKGVCVALGIPEAGPLVESPQLNTPVAEDCATFLTLLNNVFIAPLIRSDAYKTFKNYCEKSNIDIDTVAYCSGRMVGPLLDRIGSTSLLNLLKAKRSNPPLTLLDNLCQHIRDAICADKKNFESPYKKLVEFYSAGSFDADDIMYDLILNEDETHVCQRTIGDYLDFYCKKGLVQAKIIAALVYDGRGCKATVTPPMFTLSKLIKKAVEKGGDEMENFKRYYAMHPYNIDGIPCTQKAGNVGTLLINLIEELGKTKVALGQERFVTNCFDLFEVVQKDRTDKGIVLDMLIKRSQVDPSVLPQLKKWNDLYPPSGAQSTSGASTLGASTKNQKHNYFTLQNLLFIGGFTLIAIHLYKRYNSKNRKDGVHIPAENKSFPAVISVA